MHNNNRKRPAGMLAKALFTTGLLGGAALSTLGAGSAQAAWSPDPTGTPSSNSYTCTFGGSVACAFGEPTGTVGAPPNPSDKVLTLLNSNSISAGSTLQFVYQTPDSHPWHVDVDLAGVDTDGGLLEYTVQITDPSMIFDSALLTGQLQNNNPAITKQIYSDPFSTKICDITIGPFATQNCNISGQQIWVRDTWQAGQGVDNFANDFSQTSRVPGPLPLLGAGAAFGFSRQLRKRVKGARLA